MRYLAVFALALALTAVNASAVDLLKDLCAKDRQAVEKGESCVTFEDIRGKPWPRVSVYRVISASPAEVAAVFGDYEAATEFVPNLKSSRIDRRTAPNIAEVTYDLNVPLLPDERYTARNKLLTEAQGYRFEWILLRSLQAESGEGHFSIQPHPKGSVVRYTNLVVPSSGMAGLLRGVAIDQTQDTLEAISDHVEQSRKRRPTQLSQQVQQMLGTIAP